MNIDFENARLLMVENQLRPNKINNDNILELFRSIKKEDFLEDSEKIRIWRLGAESNRCARLCRPLHNHSATEPLLLYERYIDI